MIGVFSDCDGDLGLFDAAMRLLAAQGVRRFFYAGGRYRDLDDWVKARREEVKAIADYSNGDFLSDVSRHLVGQEQLERPAAFGVAHDQARTVEELARLKERVMRTPERGSLEYQDPKIPKKAVDMVGDVLCCLVHDKNDLDKEDMLNAVILVHGKEKDAAVVQIGPRYFVTPGRLKGGTVASVGLLGSADKGLTFSALSLEGKIVLEPQSLVSGARAKVTVK